MADAQQQVTFNSYEDALEKFNEHLAKLFLKQRWNTLEEIGVEKKIQWQQLISSSEILKIVLWVLMVNLRIGFISFLATTYIFYIVIVFHIFLHGSLFIKNYNEHKPAQNALMMLVLKEIGYFLIVFLGFEAQYLDLPLPQMIKTFTYYTLMGILFQQVQVFSDLSLTFQLANKILIRGSDWQVQRLAMMNQKAVDLHQFYNQYHQKALALKKNK